MSRNTTSSVTPPSISCLMVTQQGKLDEARYALDCFIHQQMQAIELVIVHDSSDSYHLQLLDLINAYRDPRIHIHQEPAGHTLGWLRNRSVEHANADLVCQWDDDDYNHPDRLQTQYNLMQEEGTDFCLMTDQLHLFTNQRFLFWDNWHASDPPYDMIENTMLGKRDFLCNYPDVARGEDTAIVEHIFTQNYRVSRLRNKGWLYTYVYNGKNTWDFKHHSEISFHKRMNAEDLLSRKEILEKELKKYHFPFDKIYMPHEKGRIELRL